MKDLFISWRGLQLFAEGAGAGVSGADAGSQTGAEGSQGAAQVPDAGVPKVVQPSRESQFEQMIRGEYKDLYDANVQKIVQSRLKGTSEKAQKFDAMAPMLELLGSKYGVSDASDVQALIQAIEADDGFYEEEAMKQGLTVAQYKDIQKMKQENAKLTAQLQQRQQEERVNQLYDKWMQQGQQTAQMYPSFNLAAELGNPQFQQLLQAGIDVKTAFEVVHKDELIHGAMQLTAQQVQEKTSNAVAAGAARPRENGNTGQGAATTKIDVSKMTKKDRQEIIRRAARGEKISF